MAKGELFVGGLASSIDLTGLTYEMESKRVGGNLWVRNVPVEDLYKILKPYVPTENPSLTALLEEARGTVGLSTDFGGTVENLDLSNGVFDERPHVGPRAAADDDPVGGKGGVSGG